MFENARMRSKHQENPPPPGDVGDAGTQDGPIREVLVASGNDLQQRKKLLVRKANAVIVLPGGPGTFLKRTAGIDP